MRKYIFLGVLVLFAALAMGPQINTSGRCMTGQDCSVGGGVASSFTIDTDGTGGASEFTSPDITFEANGEAILNSADGTFDFTRDEAGTVTITASDDDATAALTIAAGGAAALTLGDSGDTSVSLISDGGTVTVDGHVIAQKNVVSLATGALTLNTVHLATAGAADYDIPDGACDAAADIGNWVTVVLEDASVVISITSDDASNIFTVHGLGALDAGDELDSVSHTVTEGQAITLTCLTAENWYSTGGQTIHTDGTIAWADGGAAD